MSGPVAHVDDLDTIYSRLEKRQLPQDPISLSERILSNGQNSQHAESNICNMVELVLPNKDRYSGSLLDSLPEGFGKYIWSDGCVYEGEWKRGMTNGRGRITWHSGAIYEGEFAGGYIDGNGMYTVPDKVTYKGGWRLNVKHGSGRKTFANRDVFEGSWTEGMIEGPGKYIWANGNVYIGNMKGGKMSGKGVMTWTNGDSFEGHWIGGMMHGFGVYTWDDGGCYVGTWSRGLKDGKGAFYPKGGKLPAVQELYLRALRKGGLIPNLIKQEHNLQISHASTVDMGNLKFPKPPKPIRSSSTTLPNGVVRSSGQAHRRNASLERRWSLEVALEKISGHDAVTVAESIVEDNEEDVDTNVPILEREYMQGVLISELVINNSLSQLSRSAKRRQKKLEKGLKRPGETIIKGHRSYDLMLNLQLGIRYTVGKITPIQRREVLASDFGPRACFWMNFPREGSQLTPPHRSVDFKWKDYCPMVFSNLREMFKIDAADYMISICGSAALRELSSPGKSGSVFFLSQDDRFMIKTLRKSEVQVLLQMLPNYHHHVQTYENTLITKFFGLHRIKAGGQKFRFVVMGNMFCTELRIHRRFDLKGSSHGRCTNKIEIDENTTLKDLDLNYQFYLEPSWREALLK